MLKSFQQHLLGVRRKALFLLAALVPVLMRAKVALAGDDDDFDFFNFDFFDGFFGAEGVLGIIFAVIQLVLSIISLAD